MKEKYTHRYTYNIFYGSSKCENFFVSDVTSV